MSHEHVSSLELLARGAATEAYDRPQLLARANGAGPEALAGLEEAKQLALRVRAELEGRRRREAEPSALFATAHDLAGGDSSPGTGREEGLRGGVEGGVAQARHAGRGAPRARRSPRALGSC